MTHWHIHTCGVIPRKHAGFFPFSPIFPQGVDLQSWYVQQQALLNAAYAQACTSTKLPGGHTSAPFTPTPRLLQYEALPRTHPASRDRRRPLGDSYVSVHTLQERDSTYGSRARTSAHQRLGPPENKGENRFLATVRGVKPYWAASQWRYIRHHQPRRIYILCGLPYSLQLV
ncbi:hypothetical protein Hanom_Chr08g00737881 [Helianthus anomalus]